MVILDIYEECLLGPALSIELMTSRAYRGIHLMSSTSIDVTLLVTRYSSSQLRLYP